jgi:hypothetical protein
MITYNLSRYYDFNNKFTIVVKKDPKFPPNLLVQPPMVFKKAHPESKYEYTFELIKKLRPNHKSTPLNMYYD